MHKLVNLISTDFLSGLNTTIHLANGENVSLAPVFSHDTLSWKAQTNDISLSIHAEAADSQAVFFVDLISKEPLAHRALDWNIDLSCADDVLACPHDNQWWLHCSWPKTAEEILPRTQYFTLKKGEEHIVLASLTGDIFFCASDKDGMHIDSGCNTFTEYHGPFLAVASASQPMLAMEAAFKYAKSINAIKIPLRSDREYPEMFEHFGWCSWDAFYTEVSADKIYEKLNEFKEKNIPIKWIIIDDGWADVNEELKLLSFSANSTKFPEGLKACVDRIKNEYGIQYVGVWHSLNAYWKGIQHSTDLANQFADSLMKDAMDSLIPCDDPDKAFLFWDAYHSYLADCGVDFVKVDNQSSSHYYLEGVVSLVAGARNQHEAIERSIAKHFGGKVINCMGTDIENFLARPFTAISRNSDDFYPTHENGFAKHIQQNIYSAMWQSQIMYCDYDMWWSGKASPVQSGLLRAISGGPVYVSDKIGDTDMSNIYPICGNNGDICRLDNAALPTLDCIYHNCEKEGIILKTYNNSGDNIVLGLFNISRKNIEESFSFDVIPIISHDHEYIAYEYFTKKYSKISASTTESLTLTNDDVRCYSLYPIIKENNEEYILMGATDHYTGIASTEKTKILVKDILL